MVEVKIVLTGRCLVGPGEAIGELKEDLQKSAQVLLEMHGMSDTKVTTSAELVGQSKPTKQEG